MNLSITITWNKWAEKLPTKDFDVQILAIVNRFHLDETSMLNSPKILTWDGSCLWEADGRPMSHLYKVVYWLYRDDLFDYTSTK